MQLDFLIAPFKRAVQSGDVLQIGTQTVPIQFVRNPRSRRYIIRLKPDGSIRATVPRVGSIKQARQFVERNADWIARQIQKHVAHPPHSTPWQHGTEILYRGERVQLSVISDSASNRVQFADQTIPVTSATDLRSSIERHLRKLATIELRSRTDELAALHGMTITRVTVRNQRSRWGSCSRRGAISLNWRLIQMPGNVRDYVILHELAHTVEHNHSPRFWRQVEKLCPDYQAAKDWINNHRGMLR